MSERGYLKFKRALENDPGLAERLQARMDEAGKENALEALAAFAKSHGFDVDPKDVRRENAEGGGGAF